MTPVVKDWDWSERVAIPFSGARPVKGLKRGRAVSVGQKLAVQDQPLKGDVHSSLGGLVEEVGEAAVIIRRAEEAVGEPPEAKKLGLLNGPELARAFGDLGLDLPDLWPGDPLIINTLTPEPGLDLAPALFGEHRETVLAGAQAAARLWPEREIVWAVSRPDEAPAEARLALIEDRYPHGLPSLVKKAVTGRRDPLGRGVLGGPELFGLGRLWRTGLPLTRRPLTLGRSNYFVPLGAVIGDLLAFADMTPGPDDLVIRGGLVRGTGLIRLKQGLGRDTTALHLIKGGGMIDPFDPCRHCGRCRRACPAGLPLESLVGLAPQKWPTLDLSPLRGCLFCGCCALACPARRPLMSLARLACFERD